MTDRGRAVIVTIGLWLEPGLIAVNEVEVGGHRIAYQRKGEGPDRPLARVAIY